MNPKYAAMIHVEWQKLSGIVNVLLNATIFLPTSTKNLWHTTAVHSFSHPREDIEDTWSGHPTTNLSSSTANLKFINLI